jgi:hypothetical protein
VGQMNANQRGSWWAPRQSATRVSVLPRRASEAGERRDPSESTGQALPKTGGAARCCRRAGAGPAGEPCTSRSLARSRQGCTSGTRNVETARARWWTAIASPLPATGHRRPESWGSLGRGGARALISQYDHWRLLCLGVAKEQFACRELFVRPSGVLQYALMMRNLAAFQSQIYAPVAIHRSRHLACRPSRRRHGPLAPCRFPGERRLINMSLSHPLVSELPPRKLVPGVANLGRSLAMAIHDTARLLFEHTLPAVEKLSG